MRYQAPRLMTACLFACVVSSDVLADDPEKPAQEVEIGVGYVSDNSAKFGRYNGLNKDGPYAIGNLDLQQHGEDGYYGKLRGTNLGLDSRYLRLDAGRQGRLEGFLEFDQLDVHNSEDTVTPFSGNNSLRLPGTWIKGNSTGNMPLLNNSLQSLDLETERKRYGVGLSVTPKTYWNFGVSYHHEKRDGTDSLGASMAYLSGASILPAPVDYTTDEVQAALGYNRHQGQLELAYHMSLFNNDNKSLNWENPYSQGIDSGRLALAPDNQFHQVSLSGGYQLPRNTRVTGLLSVGLMTQDESFLPYSTNTALSGPLPRNDLNGKVYITTGRLQVNARPLPKWDYNASLRYYERDNDTPKNDYNYVITDLFPGGTRRNQPYSYRQQQVEARVGYRLTARTRVSLGYNFDNTSRNQAEVNNTHEHSLKATLRTRPRNDLTASLYVVGSKRTESGGYTPLSLTTNPALRVYYLAKRSEGRAGTSINYTPTERISVSASADYVHDQYTDSTVGLRSTTHPSFSADASYTPLEHVTTYAFYTYDSDDAKQRGSQSGETRDWNAKTDDTSNTFGVGAKWDAILNKYDLGVDYVYNRSEGQIGLGRDGDFPALVNRLKSLSLHGSYHIKQNMEVRLGYRHENFNSKDWAIDGVAPDTIDQVLSLGGSSADYEQDVYTLSLRTQLE